MSKIAATEVVNTDIVAGYTVREIERIDTAIQREIARRGGRRAIAAGLAESIGIPGDVARAAMLVWRNICMFRYTPEGEKLTVRELDAVIQDARRGFLSQHVLNYCAHYVVRDFKDWLDDKKLIRRFSKTEGYWRKLDTDFRRYVKSHTDGIDPAAIGLFEDHVRLSYDNIAPRIGVLETAVRDHLIRHRREMLAAGQKDDIATIQKAAVCLMFVSLMWCSFGNYFMEIVRQHGVDLSTKFLYADLSAMSRNFVFMCEAQGLKFTNDERYGTVLLGVCADASDRVSSVWNGIVRMLEDEDLSDRTAERAIGLNPEINADYQDVFEDVRREREEQKKREMDEAFRMLGDKYKVTEL